MDPNILELARLKTFLTRAHTAKLGFNPSAPPVPAVDEYARPWGVYEELQQPLGSRALIQVRRFEELGQRIEVNAHKFVNRIDESILIDWDGNEAANLKLPAPGVTVMSPVNYERLKVEDTNSFTVAVYSSIIVTAMECVRIIQNKEYGKSSRFSRKLDVCPGRGASWDILLYLDSDPNAPQKQKMAIVCIPPWAFSKLDMEEFATAGIVPSGALDFAPESMQNTNAMMLWAVIHDICKSSGIEYFIVTTYDHWVFGNMSKGRTTATISGVLDFSAHDDTLRTPNLLQLVTYWSLLSLGEERGWQLPQETPGFIRPHC